MRIVYKNGGRSMKCHNCGSNDESERFCKKCGQVLREEPDVVDAQNSVESETMTDEENTSYSDNLLNQDKPENPFYSQTASNSEGNNLPPDYVYNRNDTVWIVILTIFVAIIFLLAIADEFISI